MRTLTCERQLTIDKCADEVWEWLSDIRNVMTANQFHESVDVKEPVTGPGPVIPIMHNVFGRREVRLARVTQYKKYHVAWGERLAEEHGVDSFPHSIFWRIEPIDERRCTLHGAIRGQWARPMGKLIGPYVWNLAIPPVLEADLRDAAYAVGAIKEKPELRLPPEVSPLYRLMGARMVDSTPIEELVAGLP